MMYVDTKPHLQVAAAVLERSEGQYFLASRPEGKPWAGYWEFPGGKIEEGETPRDALVRELREELGIEVQHAHPWLVRVFEYSHAKVTLHFFRVKAWVGSPEPREHQTFSWQHRFEPVTVSPLLPANVSLLHALALPDWMALSRITEWGWPVFLKHFSDALKKGLRFLQLREPTLSPQQLSILWKKLAPFAQRSGCEVVIHTAPEHFGLFEGATGLHVNSARLRSLTARPEGIARIGASVHSEAELACVETLGLDYAVLGSVKPTESHPGGSTLGEVGFEQLVSKGWSFPIYALGGLTLSDLEPLQQRGAHGVALLRGSWFA